MRIILISNNLLTEFLYKSLVVYVQPMDVVIMKQTEIFYAKRTEY